MARKAGVWLFGLVACLSLGCPHDRAKRSFADGLDAHKAGNIDAAKASYADALSIDAGLVGVRINLAVLHLLVGEWKEAETLLTEELRLHHDDFEVNAAAALYWSTSPKADEAQRLAKFVVEHADSAPSKAVSQAQLALAIASHTIGDPYAVDFARAAYKSSPKPAQTFVLGSLLAETRNCIEGAGYLQQLIDDVVFGPSARTNLAILRDNCGDLPGGLATALPLKELAAKNSYAQGVLGTLLLRSNRLDEALVALENTVTLAPDRPGVRNTLAVAQYKAGRVDSAKSTLDAEIRLFPTTNELPYRNLAWIYVQETDFRRAIDVLTAGAAAFPSSDVLPQSLTLLRQFVQP
ncbi:MAG: tetratricopeptide repeat protein [Myxococcales bacterium]|nr:tetratricopeptide repeat protein [Myxococcales bacterium]